MRTGLPLRLSLGGLFTGLLGMSIARLLESGLLPGFFGGAALGAVAVLVSWPFRKRVAYLEQAHSASELAGMRLGTIAVCIGFIGWLVVVFASKAIGVAVIVLAMLSGFVGLVQHWLQMARGHDEA